MSLCVHFSHNTQQFLHLLFTTQFSISTIIQVSKWYNLVVYTAGDEEYATKILDFLDNGRGILNRRFFKQVFQHCCKKLLLLVMQRITLETI